MASAGLGRSATSDSRPLGPRISDNTYEVLAQMYEVAVRLHGDALSAAQLAQPLMPASEAQCELLARTFAENPRFELFHDAMHLGNVLSRSLQHVIEGAQLRAVAYRIVTEFYNSDEWLAAADSRQDTAAVPPPQAARAGDCTFCPGVVARVWAMHEDYLCCSLCLQPTMRAYMRWEKDRKVPLCCAECARAPWKIEISDPEEVIDENGYMVLYAELTERRYPACGCGLKRDPESVLLRRIPRCSGCAALLHEASSRKRCG